MPKLVPHPTLQPGTEVGDPPQGKTKVSPGQEGWNPALRGRILRVSGPRPKSKIPESENPTLVSVSDRFSAKVGPGTVTNSPGLKNAPYIDQQLLRETEFEAIS